MKVWKTYLAGLGQTKKPAVKKKKTEEDAAEDAVEGFSNNNTDTYERIYKPEYEYGKRRRRIGRKQFAELANQAKSGKLNGTKLKQLLNTGRITQSQYNMLFGFSLDFSGFGWKNINAKPKSNEGCPKWNKNCGDNGTNIMEYIKRLIAYIKKIVGYYSQGLRYVSTLIYKSTDGKLDNKPSKSTNDVSIIANILHYILMTPLSIYFAYNWFFITFYRDPVGQPIKIEFSDMIMKLLRGFLKRLFKRHVQPMILLDTALRIVIPKGYYIVGNAFKGIKIGSVDFSLASNIMTNPLFIFIWLVVVILIMVCAFSEKVADKFLSYLLEKEVPHKSYLHGIALYDWIVGFADVGQMGQLFGLMEVFFNPLGAIFWGIVLEVFSHLTVRFGGLFFILYLYVMSYFAIAIYSVGGVGAAMKNINSAFETAINTTDSKCTPSAWEKFIMNLLNIIYKYLFAILYIMILLYSILLILIKMDSSSSQIILSSALVMVIAIIVMAVKLIAMQNDKGIQKSDIDLPKEA